MTMIVTRQQAADHLRIDNATAEADDLDLKILAASAVVLDYIELSHDDYTEIVENTELDSDDSDWDSDWEDYEEIIYPLQAATLLLVGEFHRYRDGGSPNYTDANLPPVVRAILYPLKSWGLST